VIASPGDDVAVADLVDAAVADVRPISIALLY